MQFFKRSESDSRQGGWIDLGIQAGLTLALSVVLFTLGGRWLDAQLGTSPLFLIVGTLWGAGGGTWWVILRVKQYSDKEEKRAQSGDAEGDRG
ncbi:AtpZ/AtpI family protein [bacterium]|nr:AtpZ/AtpI family protein [bacterium]